MQTSEPGRPTENGSSLPLTLGDFGSQILYPFLKLHEIQWRCLSNFGQKRFKSKIPISKKICLLAPGIYHSIPAME